MTSLSEDDSDEEDDDVIHDLLHIASRVASVLKKECIQRSLEAPENVKKNSQ
jgi:hypothetical protein